MKILPHHTVKRTSAERIDRKSKPKEKDFPLALNILRAELKYTGKFKNVTATKLTDAGEIIVRFHGTATRSEVQEMRSKQRQIFETLQIELSGVSKVRSVAILTAEEREKPQKPSQRHIISFNKAKKN